MTLSTVLAERFAAIVGPSRVLTDAVDTEPFQQDWRGRYRRAALAVLMPSSTDEVSALVKTCASLNVTIVPQGGNTGLTGGAVAGGEQPSVIFNVSRLNRNREIDAH